ncbi:MAG: AbrB/MazE/SpoVT family DNA-binding domain-containing protein, partial [Chloroflexota bacterium]|nr:AbrB/MazE/SpoVT family DNA-binding domain-containing protein [Chloroflexota bacterium]
RVLIPAGMRRAAGFEPGASIVVRLEGEQVVLIPRDTVKRRLRRMFAGIDGSMTEGLIADRQVEAARGATPWPLAAYWTRRQF